MSAGPLLTMESVGKTFRRGGLFARGRVEAVRDVTLSLPAEPSIVAIVGESGSGKTTLARMVLRLVEPSAGTIRLDGRPVHGPRRARIDDLEFRRLVQPIFQNPFEAYSIHLPVDFYLFRTAINLGMAADEASAEPVVEEALGSVGLGLARVRGKYVQQFSGGELQRIAIARALIPRPRLIVADEPVSMVDASLRMTIVNLFTEIRASRGVSFIYITHDLSTATYVADRIVIMTRGEIVEEGPPAAITANPSHDYTRLLMDSIPRIGARWPELAELDRQELPGRTT
ncbi:MAG: ABC transporter ATP-binding protein [Alphaproteobacteria bacterium]|nr:ABC transporter ATP-binding protein [Alphaproteobacteria bacterium]